MHMYSTLPAESLNHVERTDGGSVCFYITDERHFWPLDSKQK